MLDSDLAAVYGVTTKRLSEQFRRNRNRFPKDFAFQLTTGEFEFFKVADRDLKREQSWTCRPDVVANCDRIKAEHPLQALGIHRTRRVTSSKHFA